MSENEPKLFKKYILDNRFKVKYTGKNDENTGYLFKWKNPKNEIIPLNRHFQHINEQSLIPIEDEEEGSTDNEIEDDPFSGVPNHNIQQMNPGMFQQPGVALGVIGKNKKSKKNTKSKRNRKSKKNRKSKRNKRNTKSKLLHKI
jgi:hypothetical protein